MREGKYRGVPGEGVDHKAGPPAAEISRRGDGESGGSQKTSEREKDHRGGSHNGDGPQRKTR